MEEKLSESGKQFADIFVEHHNPLKKQERKIKLQRRNRAKQIKEDTGN